MFYKQLLGNIDGGDVLDVGCGSGQFTSILVNSLASFNSITGIDVDEEVLKNARESFPGKDIVFQTASSHNLPFNDNSFDMAVISKALHHLENPERGLNEMYRVLKPGGWMLLNEMHRDILSDEQESHLHYHHLRSEIDNAFGISHHQTFFREDLIRLGSGLGLSDMQVLEFIPEPGRLSGEELYQDFYSKMDVWMEGLIGHSREEEFAGKIEKVKQRIRRFGISYPPQLVITGRK
jgi:ubiquinone/menaquinone biosynthesis C-methylase UbiE